MSFAQSTTTVVDHLLTMQNPTTLPSTLVEAFAFHRRTLEQLRRSPQTLRLYRVYQDAYLAFLQESGVEPTLDALTPQLVRGAQDWLRSRSHGRRGGVMAERTLVEALKTFARFARDNDIFPYDPLDRLRRPRVAKIKRKPFTQDEARRLVQAAIAGPNPLRDRALVLMLFDTGCRVGELCASTVHDVDLARGSILFRHTKNGRPREVPFRVPGVRDGGPCAVALRAWLRVREAREGIDALFTTRERLPLSSRRAREIFAELGEAARVPDCVPHRCRHTAASEFLAERPGAEIQLRSRLGQVSHDVLQDYVSIGDRTAEEMAGVASLSSRWGLAGRIDARPPTSTRQAPTPAPRARSNAPRSAEPVDAPQSGLQGLAAQLAADPSFREALMQALLARPD